MSETTTRTFIVSRTLGRGGFGEVYQAEMTSPSGLVSTVAVKVLHTGLDPRSQAIRRLKDEGRILSMLRHPAIVAVHDLAVLDGRVALVTEFVEGADLPECTTGSEPMPLGAVLEAIAGVAGALHAAHEARDPSGAPLGLLHRDVKPGNIRIGRHGQVKLLDFGIATASNLAREANTQTNALIGSFPYMAPERFRKGLPVGPASDFYSLGCTLFEAIAGHRLFPAEDMAEIFAGKASESASTAVIEAGLAPLDVPDAVKSLVRDLVAFDASERPTGPEVLARLEDLASDVGGQRLGRWARERSWSDAPPDDDPGPLSGRTLLDGDASPLPVVVLEVPAEPAAASEPSAPAPKRGWGRVVGGVAVVGLGVAAVVGLLAVGGLAIGWVVTSGDTGPTTVQPVAPDGPEPDGPEPDGPEPDGPEPDGPEPDGPEPDGPGPEPAAPDPKPAGLTVLDPAPGVAPGAGVASADCGDSEALEARASTGVLTSGDRACLGRLVRDGSGRLVERRKAGRIVLIDGRKRCDAGKGCGDYEREQAYFLEELDQSDPEMMFAWATHLEATGKRTEARLWVERALERKSAWSGSTYVKRVEALYALDAKAAYAVWDASPRDERLRIEARDAAARWASYRGQLGKDTRVAMELCTSAAGSAAPCEARVHDSAASAEIVFTSVPAGAEVLVDGAGIGNTPVKAPLSFGSHEVVVRASGVSGTRTIEVGTGKPTRWTWTAEGDDWKGAL
ncbi:MAG: serine/threonine-protein kinase [Myxococcota bacterium]